MCGESISSESTPRGGLQNECWISCFEVAHNRFTPAPVVRKLSDIASKINRITRSHCSESCGRLRFDVSGEK
jgi:hypothetical protein